MTLPALLLLSGLLASVSAQSPSQPGLHSLAVAAGKLFFGTATDTNLFNDTAYMSIVNDQNEFGILVPENSQKWEPTEPQQGDFVFNSPDRVLSLAKRNTQMFRCHTLTWFQQLPTFGKFCARAGPRWAAIDLLESHNDTVDERHPHGCDTIPLILAVATQL